MWGKIPSQKASDGLTQRSLELEPCVYLLMRNGRHELFIKPRHLGLFARLLNNCYAVKIAASVKWDSSKHAHFYNA